MAQGDENTARPIATQHKAGAVSLDHEHAHDKRNRVLLGVNFGGLPGFRHIVVVCKMPASTFTNRVRGEQV
jgi:hypothetical protein